MWHKNCDCPLEFLDWFYKTPNLVKHLNLAKKYTPKYAVAPDIWKPGDIENTLLIAKKLKEYAENVIIPIHFHCEEKINGEFIIGIPCQPTFAKASLFIGSPSLRDRPVHLLGGAPHKQMFIAKHLRNVVSVDSNIILTQAIYYKRYWENGKWVRDDTLPKPPASTRDWLKNKNRELYRVFEISCRNVAETWKKQLRG